MDTETMRTLLGWCTLVNLGLLLWLWAWVALAGDWVYQVRRKLLQIDISRPVFDAITYASIILYKLLVIVFNLVPYLVLRFAF